MNRREFLSTLPFLYALPGMGMAHRSRKKGEQVFFTLQKTAGRWNLQDLRGDPLVYVAQNGVHVGINHGSAPFIQGPSIFDKDIARQAGEAFLSYADVWDPLFKASCERKVISACRNHASNPNLIGWTWGEEPMWNLTEARYRGETDWVSTIRQSSVNAPGKHQYVQFLLNRYGNNLKVINHLYGSNVKEARGLLQFPFIKTDTRHPQIFKDDIAFLGIIAREHYRHIASIFRQTDSNHLQLGPIFHTSTPETVLKEASENLHFLTIQIEVNDRELNQPSRVASKQLDRLTQLHKISKLPILVRQKSNGRLDRLKGRPGQFAHQALSNFFVVGYNHIPDRMQSDSDCRIQLRETQQNLQSRFAKFPGIVV